MRIDIPTGRGKGRAVQLTAERLINMYPEAAPSKSKSPVVLHGTPGFSGFANLDNATPIPPVIPLILTKDHPDIFVWYTMDNLAVLSLRDETDYLRNSTLEKSGGSTYPIQVPGAIGQALEFNGTTEYVSLNWTGDLGDYDSGSISFIFKASDVNGAQALIITQDALITTDGGMFIYLNGPTINFRVGDGVTWTGAVSGGAVAADTVYRVCFTWSKSHQELFVDGVSVALSSTAFGGSFQSSNATLGAVMISGLGSPFHGFIDQFRLWRNYTLTAQDIADLNGET